MGWIGDVGWGQGGWGTEAASNRPHGSFGLLVLPSRIDIPCIGVLSPNVPAAISAGSFGGK